LSSSDSSHITEVIYGRNKVIEEILRFVSKTRKKIDACVDHTRPLLAIQIEPLKKSFINAKGSGISIRYVTEITNDNISYCKELMKMTSEIRHLDGIKGNFYISDIEYISPATLHEKGKSASQMIYSNVKEVVEHQLYVFDTLWNKAIPAEQKIKEIEEGIEPELYEVITDHEKASQILVDLAKSVKKEALFILPNDKAMVRVDRLGIIDYLIKASQNDNTATLKVICPISEVNSEINKKVSENAPNIRILNGNISPYGMYIVDDEKAFRAELKEPEAETFSEAIGFSVYSNRRNTVDFFKSVFELLWNERQLNEELIKSDKMQKEFINVAAHELRTPIVPILGLSEILRSRIIKNTPSSEKNKESSKEQSLEMLDMIIRNAGRLSRLTEDILDVTKIESRSLILKKERFDLDDIISNTVQEFKRQIETTGDNVKLVYEESIKNGNGSEDDNNTKRSVFVEADKSRIAQVVSNLLGNAIKFTNEGGTVNISIDREKEGEEDHIIVTVRNTGTGIDPEIFPRLFTKFVTKSFQGTGLGLFISKSIIEAHRGKIWAENNIEGKGATFHFMLPILDTEKQQQQRQLLRQQRGEVSNSG
jgi:two-component system, OmpR family, sensor histidine kinase VicK